jgi:dTDP-4-dehydrorhamnose 3,5-epimerase-like enzyme
VLREDKPPVKVTPTAIPDVLVLEPKVFGDARGFFLESFNQKGSRSYGDP